MTLDEMIAGLEQLAADAKAGTEHAAHDGWSWPYPSRDLLCGCGAVLIPAPRP